MKPDQCLYSWEEFDLDCEKIAQWAKDKNFKSVYGIPRGGLVVAVKVSHLLDIPLALTKKEITRDTLIVDDIVDGGTTLIKLKDSIQLTGLFTASLYFFDGALTEPSFFVNHKTSWVVFPWETRQSSRYDGTLNLQVE